MPLWNLFLPRHYYLISCLFTELVNVLTWQCNFVDDDDMIFICFLFSQSSNIIKYFKAIHLTRDMWSCLPTTHQGVHSILSYIILFGLSPANVLINFLNFEFPFQVMISSLIASLKEVNSENAANHTTCNACALSHHLRRSRCRHGFLPILSLIPFGLMVCIVFSIYCNCWRGLISHPVPTENYVISLRTPPTQNPTR